MRHRHSAKHILSTIGEGTKECITINQGNHLRMSVHGILRIFSREEHRIVVATVSEIFTSMGYSDIMPVFMRSYLFPR